MCCSITSSSCIGCTIAFNFASSALLQKRSHKTVSKLIENALFNTNIIKAFIWSSFELKCSFRKNINGCSNIARDETDPGYDHFSWKEQECQVKETLGKMMEVEEISVKLMEVEENLKISGKLIEVEEIWGQLVEVKDQENWWKLRKFQENWWKLRRIWKDHYQNTNIFVWTSGPPAFRMYGLNSWQCFSLIWAPLQGCSWRSCSLRYIQWIYPSNPWRWLSVVLPQSQMA